MIGLDMAPTEGSFMPPSQFGKREAQIDVTASRSVITHPINEAEEMMPIEISLVVKFRNRFGQEVRTEKEVVLNREDYQRFQITTPQQGNQPVRMSTYEERPSPIMQRESYVGYPRYMHNAQTRISTEGNFNAGAQQRSFEGAARPMQLPQFTKQFKRGVGGADYASTSYSPARPTGVNYFEQSPLRTMSDLRTPDVVIPKVPQTTSGAPIYIRSGGVSLPLHYHSTLPSEYGRELPVRREPDEQRRCETQRTFNYQSIDGTPNRYKASSTAKPSSPPGTVANTRLIHTTNQAEDSSSLMEGSHLTNSEQKRKTIRLSGRSKVTEEQSPTLSESKKSSYLKIISKNEPRRTVPVEPSTQKDSVPIPPKKPSSTEQIAPPGMTSSYQQLSIVQQPSLVFQPLFPQPTEPTRISKLQRAAQPLRQQIQTPIVEEEQIDYLPRTQSGQDRPYSQKFQFSMQPPVARPDSPISQVVEVEKKITPEPMPIGQQTQSDVRERNRVPSPPTIPQQEQQAAIPQNNSMETSRASNLSKIRQAVSINDANHQELYMNPRAQETQPMPSYQPPQRFEVAQSVAPITTLDQSQLTSQRGSQLKASLERPPSGKIQEHESTVVQQPTLPLKKTSSIRSTSMIPVRPTVITKPQSSVIRGRSTSPNIKLYPKRRALKSIAEDIPPSGPFAYLMNCTDAPRAYRHQRIQMDVPQVVLSAWNRS